MGVILGEEWVVPEQVSDVPVLPGFAEEPIVEAKRLDEQQEAETVELLRQIADSLTSPSPVESEPPETVDSTGLAAAIVSGLAPVLRNLPRSPDLTAEITELAQILTKLDKRVSAGALSGPGGGGFSNSVLQDILAATTSGSSESFLLTPVVGDISPGSPLVVTPASGKALEVWYVASSPDPDNSSFGPCTATLGSRVLYRQYAYAHRQRFLGAANETLTLASIDGAFAVTVHYREVS